MVKSIMYRVKFLDLRTGTKEQSDYDSLFEAIRVAKETNLSSGERVIREAIPDKQFNEQLHLLLTSCFVYAGTVSSKFPMGDHMIFLLKVDEDNNESSIYSMPFFAMPPVAEELPIVPQTNSVREVYTEGKLIPPVDPASGYSDEFVEEFIKCEKKFEVKYKPQTHRTEPGAGNYS